MPSKKILATNETNDSDGSEIDVGPGANSNENRARDRLGQQAKESESVAPEDLQDCKNSPLINRNDNKVGGPGEAAIEATVLPESIDGVIPVNGSVVELLPVPFIEWPLRVVMVIGGIIAITLVLVARSLTPAEEGLGTHRQLGLPPCAFTVMFDGRPCPSCGMTTSWSHMTRAQVFSSFIANPGGALLALVAIIGGPWCLISGLRGKFFAYVPDPVGVVTVAVVIFGVTLVNWICRLLI